MGILDGKTAVIYGAAGGIGSATSKAFAREGATVFLAGRTQEPLDSLAREISETGGSVETALVDAMDPDAVARQLDGLISRKGKLDISYNLISTTVAMGKQLTDLNVETFSQAAFERARSCFITSTAAARIMQKQGAGVILGLTASVGRFPQPAAGGFPVGCGAIETLFKQLAVEAGPFGVRVVCLRSGGTPDNPVLQWVYGRLAEVRGVTKEEVERAESERNALKRSPRMMEVANAAVLIASDLASAITATPVNASCGEVVDLVRPPGAR